MKKELWGRVQKIIPWRECFQGDSPLSVPLPVRSPNDLTVRGTVDGSTKKIGFAEGRLRNGHPFRLECAESGRGRYLSIFVSKIGLESITDAEIDRYLREQDIYEVYGVAASIGEFIDGAGNVFWRLDVSLEEDGKIYASSPISISEFKYENEPSELRLLIKERAVILKVRYNNRAQLVEYVICVAQKQLFQERFDGYALDPQEMRHLNDVLAEADGTEHCIVRLLRKYFESHSITELRALMAEHGIAYTERMEE